jgi:uncharacterized protein
MAQRSVAPYFALTFAVTWGLQLPAVFAQRGFLPGNPNAYLPLAGLGVLGPMVAAVYLSFREGGKAQVRALFAPLLRWRVGLGWYALALFVPAALLTGILSLLNLAGRQGPVAYLPGAGALLAGLVISTAEEVGWRGYALPRMQERWGAFTASTLLGALWYLWHIPMFLGAGVPLDLGLVMLLFFVGGSLLFTWIYNGTGGSLLLAVAAHFGAHLNNSHRPLPGDVLPLLVHTIVYAALGLFVMWGASQVGAKRAVLTR